MGFAGRVAGVLGTRIVQLLATLAVSFLLARLLGPDGRGVYTLVVLVPTTLFAFCQLGLTSALTFHAGRNGSLGDLERHSVVLGLAISGVAIVLTLAVLPGLEGTALRSAPDDLLRLALLALPLRLVATFLGSVMYGRSRFRRYNLILAAQSVLSVVLVLVMVGPLRLGVPGAVWAYLAFLAAGTVAVFLAVDRERRDETGSDARAAAGAAAPESVPARGLLSFGVKLYPSTVATFLGYRADVFLLGWLMGSPAEIGIYAVAVSLAELVFNVPDSVGTVLFPRVASAERSEADAITPAMSRLTILVTALAAIALIPVAWVALTVFLPAFVPGMIPLVIILPGIVALSVVKVLTSYLAGIEHLGPVVWTSIASLVVNVGVNLVAIPAWGIAGAAFASLVSYTLYAVLLIWAAGRVSGVRPLAYVRPGREDLDRVAALLRRVRTVLEARRA